MKQATPPALRFLDDALARRADDQLLRTRPPPTSGLELIFCSNDYLGLARRSAPPRPSGAGSARLVSGDRPEHEELERLSADLVGMPQALAFTSGYAANVGLLSALAGSEDLVVSDALIHASTVDGVRLSRARVAIVPHLDVAAVERALSNRGWRRAFVVTESYFGMDADSPDLASLRRVCDAHGAVLVVDEAHALGVLGPGGRGLCVAAGIQADVVVGTYGKSFGAAGAFVAGCPALVSWLWNQARSFVFSTGLSPAIASAAAAGIRAAGQEPERRERTLAAARHLRAGLANLGIRALGSGHIIPWVVGEPGAAVALSETLRAEGIDVRAIRPPSVPVGTARLRFAVTADHGEPDIERALEAVARATRPGAR